MGTVDLPKKPHAVYPQKPEAGRRNLPDPEDLQQTITLILEEETGNVLQYLLGKLPDDVLENLGDKGSLKEKLYDFINRHYQEMFGRYVLSDGGNEAAFLTRHSPDRIAELLRSIGGAGRFNTGEIEKSPESTHETLEVHINNILREKNGAGAFLHGEGAGSVVKCIFRDNAQKPSAVTDVKLVINIPDSELITPSSRRHAAAQYLIRSLISPHIIEKIDNELNSDEEDVEERIIRLLSDTASAGLSLSNAHQGIEHIRTRGFGMAANLLIFIFDALKMDYQYIENTMDRRELVIREYEDTDPANLPDERYEIRLRYLNRDQLLEDCSEYDAQIQNLEKKVQQLWNMIEVIYQDSKSVFKVNDYEDLAKKNKSRMRELLRDKAPYDTSNEVSIEKGNIRMRLTRIHERLRNMIEFLNPVERRIVEERLDLLEKEYSRIDLIINPHQLQPGLLIDTCLTSIKRRKTTLDSMASALHQFLRSVPECFQVGGASVA